MTEQAKRERSVAQQTMRRVVRVHAVAYVVVNGVLWAAWAVTDGGNLWPAWLTGIWAIGLATKAWEVYVSEPITQSGAWRDRRRSSAAVRVSPEHR